jgi:hypothetical protein
VQVCGAKEVSEQDVCGGIVARANPTEHCIEQVAFVARLAVQLPSVPLAGAVTLHEATTSAGPNESDANNDSSSSGSTEAPKGGRRWCGLHTRVSRAMARSRRDCNENEAAAVVATTCAIAILSVEHPSSADSA